MMDFNLNLSNYAKGNVIFKLLTFSQGCACTDV